MTQVFVIGNADLTTVENVSLSDNVRQQSIAITESSRKKESHNTVESSREQAIKSENLASSSKDHITKNNNGRAKNGRTHKVDVIETPIPFNETSNHYRAVEREENTNISLSYEKKLHQEQASKREEIFKDIILDKHIEFSWEVCLSWFFGIAVVGLLSTIPISMIPAHDLIQFPEYWFEILFHGFYFNILAFLILCIQIGSFLNLRYVTRKQNIIRVLLIGVGHQCSLFSDLTTFGLKCLNTSFLFLFLELRLAFGLPFPWHQFNG